MAPVDLSPRHLPGRIRRQSSTPLRASTTHPMTWPTCWCDGPWPTEAGRSLTPAMGVVRFLRQRRGFCRKWTFPKAGKRVFGIDIDPRCANTVRSSQRLVEANCFHGDFLAASPR